MKNADESLTCTKIKVQTRLWDDKMYFYPIPEVERHKNTNLSQNSGW